MVEGRNGATKEKKKITIRKTPKNQNTQKKPQKKQEGKKKKKNQKTPQNNHQKTASFCWFSTPQLFESCLPNASKACYIPLKPSLYPSVTYSTAS